MSLSEDQLHTLNLIVNQVSNIQDRLPSQLEAINNRMNEIQGRMTQLETQQHDLLNQVHTLTQSSKCGI
ncbi:hypothetical protein INT47_010355 [Mucor saturninus]|uniref:Uncharacterized protein n=1 Tax=Mucor saturninus TaxID=64648 RepID=A0A8H7USQ3_9FUNG|nr:hypothetical protein INT47_010355 [Mucor saturninus]